MDELHKQVRSAHRRLGAQRFFRVLSWCLFVPLMIAVVIIAVGKYYPLWSPPVLGAWGWLVAAGVLGIFTSVLWLVVTQRESIRAAIEIDQRFGLKERVASTLAMEEEELSTEAGQALMKDAVRRARRVDVASEFPVAPPRRMLIPLVPIALAILVILLIGPAVVENPADANTDISKEQQERIKKVTERIRKKLAERKKNDSNKAIKELLDQLPKLGDGTKDKPKDMSEKKKALTELNDLAEELKKQKDAVGGAQAIKDQLQKLGQNLNRGPADKVEKALKGGDFKEAAKQLEDLKNKMQNNNLNQKEKDQLAKQLDDMKQKLEKMADDHKEKQKQMQKQIDKMRQAGQDGAADQMQQKLENMMQKNKQMQQMQDMAQKMGDCAQCMKEGNMKDAAKAMEGMQQQMQDLQQQVEDMEMLQEAMDQLGQAKDQMNCQACGGQGCQQCGGGQKPGMAMAGGGEGDQKGGQGLGAGRGEGERPEDKNAQGSFYDTRVNLPVEKGPADIVDFVDGPARKGQVKTKIQEQFETTKQGKTDPLTNRRIPKKRRDHAREYFDRFREGE